MKRLPIAAQVYSVREEAAADFEGTMKALAGMGYDGVELAGLYGKSGKEIREVLDGCGLKAVSAHVPYEEFERDLEGTLETYQKLGCSFLAIPSLGRERWYGGEKYRETLAALAVFAQKCGEAGMRLLYHNHDFEFAQAQAGGCQLDVFYGEKETAELATELDLCWVKVGGADPVDYLRKYAGRCPAVHVKDFVKKDKVTLVALGEGQLGVREVLAQAAESGAQWLIVEQDDHAYGTPLENMKKSMECIKNIWHSGESEKQSPADKGGTDMKKLRAGIVGCGGIAGGKHLPAMKKNGNFEIVAFCDLIEERAAKAKEEYGTADARVYTDYQELVREDLDVVYVLTPNNAHAPVTIAALRAGKHVMCEKPMAKTYAEAKAMVEAAKETGKILTIGYQNRYRGDSQYLKKACENGDLGEIYYAKAHAIRRRAVPTWGVFLDAEKQGGGPLIDIGTHALDLTLWMMDNYEPASVTGSVFRKLADQKDTGNAWGDWDPEIFTVEDSAFGFIKMKNGATIQLETSWALNSLEVEEARTSLCGTKAGADMKDGLRINRVQYGRQCIEKPNLNAGGVAFYDGASENAEDVEQRIFYEAVVNGKPLTVKPEQALVVTQILEAVYESAKTGKTVYFE